ncbi:MAG: lysophospholipid acyltransferase family protein [Dehalococcoidia bacterium]|nr:1-acyl-sn-glycerol-3-phosphate acyltransferase [Dehalococcoidia bacterium]
MGRVKALGVPAVYWTATYLLRGVLWVVGRWTVTGREHIPPEGGLIVVSNHLSNADPPILGAAVASRRLRFMAKQELFKLPLGIVPRAYGAFPVRRFDADVGALLNAERILKRGEVLAMFPEGTRSRTGKIGEPHPGTALIALRSGAPIICCSITGTEALHNPLNLLKKPRITVTMKPLARFEPVRKPTEQQVQDAMNIIFDAILAYLPTEYGGAYTGIEANDPDGDNPTSN